MSKTSQTSVHALIVKAAQHAAHLDACDIDGVLGPRTLAALREYDHECDDFHVPMADLEKLAVVVAQHAAGLRGIALDGVPGLATESAVRAYARTHGLDTDAPASPSTRPPERQRPASARALVVDGIDLRNSAIITPAGGLAPIPTRSRRDAVYGDALALGENGMQARLATIRGLPGRFNKGNGILPQVHASAVPHVVLAFELFEKFGALDEIHKIWFFNYRHQRHDSSRPLSLHAWGIACDINPRDNFAWSPAGEERDILPFSDGWCEKYPNGLSEVAVLCMKKAGFRWGGDWPEFRDPMHFELLRAG